MQVSQVPGMLKQLSTLLELSRRWMYINCWHMNEHESAAMWKSYAVNKKLSLYGRRVLRCGTVCPQKSMEVTITLRVFM